MIDHTDYHKELDFRAFGDQFFIRKSDPLEIENQISNKAYATEIARMRTYYQNFTAKIPDTGKQEVVRNTTAQKEIRWWWYK